MGLTLQNMVTRTAQLKTAEKSMKNNITRKWIDIGSKFIEGTIRGTATGRPWAGVIQAGHAIADEAGIGDATRRVMNAPHEAGKDVASIAQGVGQIMSGDYAGGVTTFANTHMAQNNGTSSGGGSTKDLAKGAESNQSAAFSAATKAQASKEDSQNQKQLGQMAMKFMGG